MKRSDLTKPRSSEGGWLLVETLLASFLLLVALLALVPLLVFGMRQNAFAKDITLSSTLAVDKVEEFMQAPCASIRRGTCCTFDQGSCADEEFVVDGITYVRECVVRQSVPTTQYADDSDLAAHSFPTEGLAAIEVTVRARRGAHFATRRVKPAVVSNWRVCAASP